MDTGKIIKILRKEKNMTQKKLAKKLGITRGAVGLYEQGKRNIDNATLDRLAQIFNVSTDYILGRTQERKTANGIKKDLTNKPELLEFWTEIFQKEDLKLLFKEVKDLETEKIRKIIEIAKIIKD